MHQIEVTAFGGPEVLRVTHVPAPEPGPGQVVIDVAAAGVLGLDLAARNSQLEPPYVPGTGVAGRVSAIGDGVSGTWLGKNVVARLENGGYAEQVLAPEQTLTEIPDGLHEHEAVALLHEGSAALAMFEAADVHSGDSVLVLPAAGALGSVLVQLAHAAGARVIAADHGRAKLELAESLGAGAVVDYGEPDWAEEAGYVDVVFDGAGGEPGAAAAELAKRRVVDHRTPAPTAPGFTERILREAAAGRIVPLIGQTYPLARAAEAHAAIESRRAIGKTLLVTRF
ncbi:zinc-binding dehydrogenase [Amycolatopsis sp. GM8]|uniref:zinc-binding dehydrogenase n=1 Tax=Amycolatopsis sp. GM8 TaxID=2896530 RepID=UPI001F3A5774|nr:zinc-binding dehydrogenase [Amycolatopsis sp. GM8]